MPEPPSTPGAPAQSGAARADAETKSAASQAGAADLTAAGVDSRRAVLMCMLETALVFLVFALYARIPVPEPNEPHYLGKAKHFWDASWIADDFFLDSADSHWGFYVACGWLTRIVSLPVAAWIGRVITWGLLAIAWQRLSFAVVPRRGAAVLSAALFVALCESCNMAGEWAVGGFEAKGLAYALVFAGVADLVRNRWNAAWVFFGAAAAFHVLIGGWAVLAGLLCLATARQRPPVATILPGLCAGAILSLVGVIPALQTTVGADRLAAAEASYIYVYERLPHHLTIFGMASSARLRFALLVGGWLVLNRLIAHDAEYSRLRRFVSASLLFVIIGIGLSAWGRSRPDLMAPLLRYYWFRMADIFLPLGVAIGATRGAYQLCHVRPAAGRAMVAALAVAAAVLLRPQIEARLSPAVPRADKPGKVLDHAAWREACRWIAENTPHDARFLTPRSAQTFKWYAGRSEVVTWKDLPQDAESIVEWWRRLIDIHGTGDPEQRWHRSLNVLDTARLRQLAAQYDAQYLLCEADPPLELPYLYHNAAYAVYELRPE